VTDFEGCADEARNMTSFGFAVLVFLSFAAPLPFLVWLDRVPDEPDKTAAKPREKR
jgi:hypothetical protein